MGFTDQIVSFTVDDEVDVTDTVEEVLDQCFVRKANDYDTGRQYLFAFFAHDASTSHPRSDLGADEL